MSRSGTAAFSVSAASGWTLTDWFENLYVRVAGVQAYDELAAARRPWTDPSGTAARLQVDADVFPFPSGADRSAVVIGGGARRQPRAGRPPRRQARHPPRHAGPHRRRHPRPVRRRHLAMVQTSLADEKITVAEDAARFGGELVNGPLTAYYQADIIEKHALEGSGGKTYAELDREDPARATVMNGSFLRASLFTSVVSFGVAALAMGLGIVFVLIGFALRTIGKGPRTA